MVPCVEVKLNSKKACLAGIEHGTQGVISVPVELVQGTPKGDAFDLFEFRTST